LQFTASIPVEYRERTRAQQDSEIDEDQDDEEIPEPIVLRPKHTTEASQGYFAL